MQCQGATCGTKPQQSNSNAGTTCKTFAWVVKSSHQCALQGYKTYLISCTLADCTALAPGYCRQLDSRQATSCRDSTWLPRAKSLQLSQSQAYLISCPVADCLKNWHRDTAGILTASKAQTAQSLPGYFKQDINAYQHTPMHVIHGQLLSPSYLQSHVYEQHCYMAYLMS